LIRVKIYYFLCDIKVNQPGTYSNFPTNFFGFPAGHALILLKYSLQSGISRNKTNNRLFSGTRGEK